MWILLTNYIKTATRVKCDLLDLKSKVSTFSGLSFVQVVVLYEGKQNGYIPNTLLSKKMTYSIMLV
jgi:hypothetical protein